MPPTPITMRNSTTGGQIEDEEFRRRRRAAQDDARAQYADRGRRCLPSVNGASAAMPRRRRPPSPICRPPIARRWSLVRAFAAEVAAQLKANPSACRSRPAAGPATARSSISASTPMRSTRRFRRSWATRPCSVPSPYLTGHHPGSDHLLRLGGEHGVQGRWPMAITGRTSPSSPAASCQAR